MDLKQIISLVYSIGVTRIPGLAIFLPLDALLAMVDAVKIGMNKDLHVDMKLTDWRGMMKLLREASDAVMTPTKREQAEAVYALLAYITDVEKTVSVDEFLNLSNDAQELLPDSQLAATPAPDPLIEARP